MTWTMKMLRPMAFPKWQRGKTFQNSFLWRHRQSPECSQLTQKSVSVHSYNDLVWKKQKCFRNDTDTINFGYLPLMVPVNLTVESKGRKITEIIDLRKIGKSFIQKKYRFQLLSDTNVANIFKHFRDMFYLVHFSHNSTPLALVSQEIKGTCVTCINILQHSNTSPTLTPTQKFSGTLESTNPQAESF